MIEEIVASPYILKGLGDIILDRDDCLFYNSHQCLLKHFDEFLFLVPKYDTSHNMTSIFSIIHAQNLWFLARSQLSVDGTPCPTWLPELPHSGFPRPPYPGPLPNFAPGIGRHQPDFTTRFNYTQFPSLGSSDGYQY